MIGTQSDGTELDMRGVAIWGVKDDLLQWGESITNQCREVRTSPGKNSSPPRRLTSCRTPRYHLTGVAQTILSYRSIQRTSASLIRACYSACQFCQLLRCAILSDERLISLETAGFGRLATPWLSLKPRSRKTCTQATAR